MLSALKFAFILFRAVLLLSPVVLATSAAAQLTIPAVASGNWSSGTTWAGGVAPGPSDTAQIGTFSVGATGSITVGSVEGVTGGALTLGSGVAITTGGNNASTIFDGVISGAGALTKAGTGTFTLTGTNVYTGGTSLNDGTLSLGSEGAIGSSGTISFGGGTLQFTANNTNISGYAARFSTAPNQPYRIDTNGQSETFSAALTSAGGTLTKLGDGALTLTGANTYTGGTNLNAGTIVVRSAGALGSTGTISFGGGILEFTSSNTKDYSDRFSTAPNQAYNINLNGKFVTFASNLTSPGGTLTTFSTSANIFGMLTLTGANTYTGGTILNGGDIGLGSAGALGSVGPITMYKGSLWFSASNTTDYSSRFSNAPNQSYSFFPEEQSVTFASPLTSAGGALYLFDSGTLTLTGANTYTGGTFVRGGTLALGAPGGNTLTTSGTVFVTGGTLALLSSQSVGDLTLGGGTISGPAPFTLFASSYTMQSGSANAALGGSGALTVVSSGSVTLSGANTYTGGTTISTGTLVVSGSGTLGSSTGTVALASGATLNLSGSTVGVSVGTLTDSGTLALGTSTLTVSSDYANTAFGTGNSFNPRAGVTGTGAINASGSTAQALTGANITAGTTAAPTLALGSIHEGDTVTRTYSVANSGTTGPALRGAVQTAANGGSITDTRLSGTGVTAANFGPVATGATTGGLGVTFTGTTPGALAGQSVAVVNNFGNVPGQVLGLTGAVYRYASATTLPASVNLGIVHVGDTVTRTVTVSNTAAASSGFTENLSASFGSVAVGLTGAGSVTGLAAGGNSTALQLTLNTTVAGALTAAPVTVNFTSEAVGGSGLGNTPLAAQTLTIAAQINNYALPLFSLLNGAGNLSLLSTNSAVLDLGAILLGSGPLTAQLRLANSVAAPADSLDGTFSLTNPDAKFVVTGANDFTQLAPGDHQDFQLGLLADQLGDFSALLTLAGVSENSGGYSGTLGDFQLQVTGHIAAALTPAQQWQTAHFGSTTAGLAQAAADPDHDGLPNLLEYALGADPLASSAASLPVPAVAINPADGLPHLTLVATLNADANDVTVTAEVTADLQTWNSGPPYTEVISDTTNGATRTLVIRDTTPLNAAAHRFMRLKVTAP